MHIYISVNGQPMPLENSQIKHIKTELRQIRDRVISILDGLEPQRDGDITSTMDSTSKGSIDSVN